MEKRQIYLKIVVNLLITTIFAILAILFIPKLLSFFFPFVLAFILSLIANPLVRFMERKIKIKRKHGSAIIIIVVLAVLVGLIYLIVSFLIREITNLLSDIPSLARELSGMIESLTLRLSKFIHVLPKSLQNVIGNLNQSIEQYLSTFFNGISLPGFTVAQSYVKLFGNAVFMGIITILATYFIIAQRDEMTKTANRVFPEPVRRGYSLIASNFKTAIGGYFKAQFKIMLVLLAVIYAAFLILRIKYAFLIALGIAFIDLLPVFGTGFIFWPWSIIAFLNENYTQAIAILVLYLVCQIVKQFLQPKMVGDSIGVSPFLSLIFMFVGYRLAGIFGLIIGIPIGMAFLSFYKLGMFDRIIRGIKIIVTDINEYRKY